MAGKVITVAQQKGGSGKTTLAANLAIALRAEGLSVAVVDLDPQGSLGRWFMTRAEADPARVEGMDFATSSAWGVSYECRKLVDRFDIVIIDTPPKADSDLRPALRAADLVLVPVAVSHLDLWATESVLDLAERVGCNALVVMNRGKPGTRLANQINEAVKDLSAPIASAALGNRVAYAEALGQGWGVLEMPRSPAHDEVRALAAEVRAILG